MDFLKAGAKESIIKFVKILGWVALSAVITKLATLIGDWKPTTSEWVIVQGMLNAVMPALVKWATTNR